MIVGFPHQTPEIIDRELSTLLKLKPAFSQFLIYGPTPGTPFYQQVMEEGLLDPKLLADNERYYRNCTGFTAMVKHPSMSAEAIEAAQQHCFEEDYQQLGPSIFRRIETWLLGYLKIRNSPNPILRKKSQLFARDLQGSQAVFKAGRVFAPNPQIREWITELEIRVQDAVGRPNMTHRLVSIAAWGLLRGRI